MFRLKVSVMIVGRRNWVWWFVLNSNGVRLKIVVVFVKIIVCRWLYVLLIKVCWNGWFLVYLLIVVIRIMLLLMIILVMLINLIMENMDNGILYR